MPTEIEIPARLMMFDDIPKSRIIRKLNRIAIGSVTATTKALPTCPITSRMAIVQTISSSLTVPLTVSMRLVDQRRAVVERDDPHARRAGRPGGS